MVQVLFPPKKVTITGPATAKVNSTVSLACKSARSNPTSSLQWVVDGRAVLADSAIKDKVGF